MSIFDFLSGGRPSFRKPLDDVRNNVRGVLSSFVADHGRGDPGAENALRRARAYLIFTHYGCEQMLEQIATERENAELFRALLAAISASPYRNIQKLFCSQALIFVTSIHLAQPENGICDVMIETALQMYSQPPSTFHDAWACYEAKQQANPTNDPGPMYTRFTNCAMKLMYDGIGVPLGNIMTDMWIIRTVDSYRNAFADQRDETTLYALAESLLRR